MTSGDGSSLVQLVMALAWMMPKRPSKALGVEKMVSTGQTPGGHAPKSRCGREACGGVALAEMDDVRHIRETLAVDDSPAVDDQCTPAVTAEVGWCQRTEFLPRSGHNHNIP